jgi:UDP-glucose 4-epimerase
VPDTSKIRALTGWTPRRSLDDILAETLSEAAAERAERQIRFGQPAERP